jgi:hypothetical protein
MNNHGKVLMPTSLQKETYQYLWWLVILFDLKNCPTWVPVLKFWLLPNRRRQRTWVRTRRIQHLNAIPAWDMFVCLDKVSDMGRWLVKMTVVLSAYSWLAKGPGFRRSGHLFRCHQTRFSAYFRPRRNVWKEITDRTVIGYETYIWCYGLTLLLHLCIFPCSLVGRRCLEVQHIVASN